MKWIMIPMTIVTMLIGCNEDEREKAFKQKQQELDLREQQLIEREFALQVAVEEFAKKQQIDTTNNDSTYLVTNNIVGNWETKMLCTQTSCPGSAIGNSKNETWAFSYENNQVTVKAIVNNAVIRIYTGKLVNNAFELVENVLPNSAEPAAKMRVRLQSTKEGSMQGLREIIRPDCKIEYSLQLTK